MISFDHFYTFNRTLKCWTTGTLVNLGLDMPFGGLLIKFASWHPPRYNQDPDLGVALIPDRVLDQDLNPAPDEFLIKFPIQARMRLWI